MMMPTHVSNAHHYIVIDSIQGYNVFNLAISRSRPHIGNGMINYHQILHMPN